MEKKELQIITNKAFEAYGFIKNGEYFIYELKELIIACKLINEDGAYRIAYNVSIKALHSKSEFAQCDGEYFSVCDVLSPITVINCDNLDNYEHNLLTALHERFDEYKESGIKHLKHLARWTDENKANWVELTEGAMQHLGLDAVKFTACADGQALATKKHNRILKFAYVSLSACNILGLLAIIFQFFWGLLIFILPFAAFVYAKLKLKKHKKEDEQVKDQQVEHLFHFRNNLVFIDDQPALKATDLKELDVTKFKNYLFMEVSKTEFYVIYDNAYGYADEQLCKNEKEKFLKLFTKYFEI